LSAWPGTIPDEGIAGYKASGKYKAHRVNVQVIADPASSGSHPPCRAPATTSPQAREHGMIDALTTVRCPIWWEVTTPVGLPSSSWFYPRSGDAYSGSCRAWMALQDVERSEGRSLVGSVAPEKNARALGSRSCSSSCCQPIAVATT
jgi:hypothetical protein